MEWFNFPFIYQLTLFLELNRDFILHIFPLVMLIMVLYSFSFTETENTKDDINDKI